MSNKKTILYAGGGTAGPVTPLLAVHEKLKQSYPDAEFHWVGTVDGPEGKLVAKTMMPFHTLPVAKYHRFLSLKNLFLPFKLVYACIKARKLLKQLKPDLIISAGGFMSVPVIWMAAPMKIKSLIHQLDILPGLANKLCAPFATAITVTFEKSVSTYPKAKTTLTGAPVRKEILQSQTETLPLHHQKPVLLVTGGGTGAQTLNEFVFKTLDELTPHLQIIHLTGKGKGSMLNAPDYHSYEFLTHQMPEALQRADIVVARAGIGTLIELAALKKPSIIIPIPNSHQEYNAELLRKNASAVILDQTQMSPQMFASQVLKLAKNKDLQAQLRLNIAQFYKKDASEKIIEIIKDLL